MTKNLNVELFDENGKSINVSLEYGDLGISISAEGYGNKEGPFILHLEYYGSEFRALAYQDRENEEPTSILRFNHARITKNSEEK